MTIFHDYSYVNKAETVAAVYDSTVVLNGDGKNREGGEAQCWKKYSFIFDPLLK